MARYACNGRSACPARPEVHTQVRRLAARTLSMAFTDRAGERAMVAEVPQRLPGLRLEPAGERARGDLPYAEAEESEAGLERFRTWLAKIAARAAIEEAALHAEAGEPGQVPINEAPPPRVVHRP
ncbi:hypothetical protein [Spongiactinospora sp. 9N601]|uniref:hypothetical protein n=1 Tax=Spongiactinospora sp. 9N601 TaxID=3375149 RepID=UPI0037A2677E